MQQFYNRNISQTAGSSLIALLLYLGIGTIILATLLQSLYSFCQQYKNLIKQFTQLQHILLLHHMFTQDINNAGFQPCRLQATPSITCCNPSKANCELPKYQNIKQDSDVLILDQVPVNFSVLVQDMQHNYDTLQLAASQGLHPGDILNICNLLVQDQVQIQAVYNNLIQYNNCNTHSTGLQQKYSNGTMIYRNTRILYYLQKSVQQTAAQTHYSLYRADTQRQAVALIDEVADFRVTLTDYKNPIVQITLTFLNGAEHKFIFKVRNSAPAI